MHIPILGIIIPKMGSYQTDTVRMQDALFSRVQQLVLGFLFGQPDRRFQGAELIRMANSGTGAVHRQLTSLTASGLVNVTQVGNQKYYQANSDSPVFEELCGLIRKTIGLREPLRRALEPWKDQIDVAFVYGSIARGADTATSDIDLMLIGDGMDYISVYEALQKAETILHRQVNPNLSTLSEWRKKLNEKNSFIVNVNKQAKLFIYGSEDGLA